MRKNSAKGGWLVEKGEDPVGQETPAPPLLLARSYCSDAAARGKKKINHQAPKLDIFFPRIELFSSKIGFSNLRKRCKKINFLIKKKNISSRALLGDRLRGQANEFQCKGKKDGQAT